MSWLEDRILCPCQCGRLILRDEYRRWTGQEPPPRRGRVGPSYKTYPIERRDAS